MDAKSKETHSDYISRREKRWSMNSQRLEEIVAELMKPIGDVRRSFDTDLSALLEEYLTEAGLRALEAGEPDGQPEAGEGGPNFAELALLLQQSASIYGRKVDFLYQHVLSVSDSLHHHSIDESPGGAAESTPARRRRRESQGGAPAAAGPAGPAPGFAAVPLQACAGCSREGAGPAGRPPPTLPRLYLELEPRALAPGDAPLTDYAGEPVGLLQDFHVCWPLRRGMLRARRAAAGAPEPPGLRALPLPLLQAAIEAAAPPPDPHDYHAGSPSPPPAPPPDDPAPPAEDPAAPAEDPASPAEDPAPAAARARRKRKCGAAAELLLATRINLVMSREGLLALQRPCEFSLSDVWADRTLARRRGRLLRLRRRARACDARLQAGFCGWSAAEAERAAGEAQAVALRLLGGALAAGGGALATGGGATEAGSTAAEGGTPAAKGGVGCDSDDDGFFEQSSLGDSDSRVDDSLLHTPCAAPAEWAAWRAGVLSRAAHAAGPDVHALARRVLAAVPDAPGAARPWPAVLRAARAGPRDVSQLFLAALFLANAGAVELQPAATLALAGLRVRALSRDPRLYGAAAAAAAAELPSAS